MTMRTDTTHRGTADKVRDATSTHRTAVDEPDHLRARTSKAHTPDAFTVRQIHRLAKAASSIHMYAADRGECRRRSVHPVHRIRARRRSRRAV